MITQFLKEAPVNWLGFNRRELRLSQRLVESEDQVRWLGRQLREATKKNSNIQECIYCAVGLESLPMPKSFAKSTFFCILLPFFAHHTIIHVTYVFCLSFSNLFLPFLLPLEKFPKSSWNHPPHQGGWIIYFGESFSVSMDMINNFWKIVFHFMVWRNYSYWI